MSNVNKLRKICPYTGQGEGQECKMTKGGLYIPMPEHIEMFCQTPKFVECHQYIRGSELLKETAQKYGFILDGSRRRYRRVLDRFMVSLAVCDENGTPKEILDENAHTIDISLGGMRIDSSSDIAGRGLIAFEFGSDFVMPILEGVGEIKWATEIKGNGGKGFHAGVAFLDSRISHAIGTHMGLPM